MTKTFNWDKLPSVTRPGKSFYRCVIPNGPSWTVAQSWISGRWCPSNNHNGILANQDFETAKSAKNAVERYYRIDTL